MSLETGGTAVAVALLVLLAGCGSDEPSADPPDLPSETPALWNPCDAIDAAFVMKQFGTDATEENGSPTAPECRFVPVDTEAGDPALEANYQLFTAGLDAAWDQMGISPDADVISPKVRHAEAARIVVSVADEQLLVTGFVENGDLIQSINVVDPAPFAKGRVIAGVQQTLAAFSQLAEDKVKESSSPE